MSTEAQRDEPAHIPHDTDDSQQALFYEFERDTGREWRVSIGLPDGATGEVVSTQMHIIGLHVEETLAHYGIADFESLEIYRDPEDPTSLAAEMVTA